MALWRKSFNNLGGTEYVADARVAESQRQQQIDNANAAALRASQIQQAQLQQQRADSGWQNKLAMEQLALQKLASDFNYGQDARSLRAREAELPWARMDQQQGQFDASLGLDRERLGFQQEQFDYSKAMNASPEEAALNRALRQQLDRNALTRDNAMSAPEILSAQADAATAKYRGDVIRNDPSFLQGMQGEALFGAGLANDQTQANMGYAADENAARMEAMQRQKLREELGYALDERYLEQERLQRLAAGDQSMKLAGRQDAREESRATMELDRYMQGLGDSRLDRAFKERRIQGMDMETEAMRREMEARDQQAAISVMQIPEFQNLISGGVSQDKLGEQVQAIMSMVPQSQRQFVAEQILAAQGQVLSAPTMNPVSAGADWLARQLPPWLVAGDPRAEFEARQIGAQQNLSAALAPYLRR